MISSRLVSIVTPAYKADYFEAALTSALSQDHDALEIVICDDCPSDAIKRIVDRLSVASRWPIRYFRNEVPLGEALNLLKAVQEASGDYIKFLYDDDLLQPACVSQLFEAMDGNRSITIATSQRRRIGEHGEPLPDTDMTRPAFSQDVLIHGTELASFIGQFAYNFIGEPSAVMCRRQDLLSLDRNIMAFGGEGVDGIGDLALFIKLLRRGNLAVLARPLSSFRVSRQQFSHATQQDLRTNIDSVTRLRLIARKAGWTRLSENNAIVKVASLADPENFIAFDLHSQYMRLPNPENRAINSWLAQRVPDRTQQALIDDYLENHPLMPTILIVISDMDNQQQRVRATLKSLSDSVNLSGHISVALLSGAPFVDDGKTGQPIHWIETHDDSRPQVLTRLLREHQADWFMLADAGEQFTASGLLQVVLNLTRLPTCRALYADELYLQPNGAIHAALRPDFNLDYLLSFPAGMSRHWLFNRQAVMDIGGIDETFSDALELDLILRLIEDSGLDGLEHICEPLLTCPSPVLEQSANEVRALQRHLEARGYPHSDIIQTHDRHYQLCYGHQDRPLISILVPTPDRLALLQRCIESILEKSAYPYYEILIIDNGCQAPDAMDWLAAVESMDDDRIRILRYTGPLNVSWIYNLAAEEAHGEYLLLLSGDTAVLHSDWLENLLNHALRPEVGLVGAKLFNPDSSVKHAGMILGLGGIASRVFCGEQPTSSGYMQRLIVDQNYSAVTSDCMMVRRSLFDAVGGFDESLVLTFSDVDLCLRVSATGHLIVWTPHVRLLQERHAAVVYEPDEARQQMALERQHIKQKWLPALARDRAYNSNLSLTGAGFELNTDNSLSWQPLCWRPLPIILSHSQAHSILAESRIARPLKTLQESGSVEGATCTATLNPVDVERLHPDTIILQGAATLEDLHQLRESTRCSSALKIMDMIEYPAFSDPKSAESRQSLKQALSFIDKLVVASASLASALDGIHPQIRVLESRLSPAWRNQWIVRRSGLKPRVGWTTYRSFKATDWNMIQDVVRALAHEVEWVVMGECPAELAPWLHERRSLVSGELYPSAVAGMWLDVAIIAPGTGTDTDFLQLLEYGACGFPVIYAGEADMNSALPVTRIRHEAPDWIAAIRAHINDLDAAAQSGDELRRQVLQDWMLEGDHLHGLRTAWLER
ncbi:glycosyltransferase family 2 protein [Pseudomonas sp. CDFA 602]|uniref:glycosyltransferase family 2 protein n=1 Tax=Pseudomonas californiensis TaxID=2829823 RepID=UPI001E4685EA|nr:glycosyltransferase family 2 protein [Pseudomonas californiensis]MCD5996849.1 glycosyltransferase family 2 protein [Pseudomonas californiensis]MCD5998324.1 glycosyltransferase family 2 protein [Pseudomonas californiensis]